MNNGLTKSDLEVLADMNRGEYLFKNNKGLVEKIGWEGWRQGRMVKAGTADKLLSLELIRKCLNNDRVETKYILTDNGRMYRKI
jgi:hypothetical protein